MKIKMSILLNKFHSTQLVIELFGVFFVQNEMEVG